MIKKITQVRPSLANFFKIPKTAVHVSFYGLLDLRLWRNNETLKFLYNQVRFSVEFILSSSERFFTLLRMTSKGLRMTLLHCHSEGAKRPKNLNIEIPVHKFSFVSIICFLLLSSFPSTVNATESKQLSVNDIVEKTNCVSYYQGKDGRAQVSMIITDNQDRKRNRRFTILRRNEKSACKDQKFYVYFHRPADVNKTVFMVWKHIYKDDDRWLYLPALDLVKRIAASDERTSFVGSNFFYEDVSGRNIAEDTHELVDTTKNYYVLKNSPKDPEAVEFSSYKAWVHRKTFLPVKIEYYDKNKIKYRIYEALKVETIEGYPTVTQSRMKDLRSKGETVISYKKIKYNVGLPDDIFTERYLRNPPKKYLR